MVGKRVWLVLRSGHQYTGKITAYDGGFITIIDKFGLVVGINVEEIKVWEQMREKREDGK